MLKSLYISIILLIVNNVTCLNGWHYPLVSKDPDVGKNPCQLIESRNFKCEEHFITTSDGYILSVQRIINPVYQASGKKTIKPIVLQHGLFGSATHFLVNSVGGFASDWTVEPITADLNVEGRNLAYFLANFGYDVWISNSRGNKFSKNHTTLNPKRDLSYWRFSFDEMIAKDSPAIIDHILAETGFDHLGWIGHSQGTMLMFGLLSSQPEYTDKVKPFIAMAPIAHVEHITSPIRYLIDVPGLMDFFFVVGGELTLPQILVDLMSQDVCDKTVIKEACGSALFLICGYDSDQFNYTRIPVYFDQGLGGTSSWDLLHFGQNIINKGFRKFDFGLLGNIEKYGTIMPPEYDLGAIRSENIVLFWSNKDIFTDQRDLQRLRLSLTVPITEYRIVNPEFSHLDFIWAKDVYHQVHKPILEVLRKY